MTQNDISEQVLEARLQEGVRKGQEIFKELETALLKADQTIEGSTAMMYAISKAAACVVSAYDMTGMPTRERFNAMIDEWAKLLRGDHYDDLYPFDLYVFRLMSNDKALG